MAQLTKLNSLRLGNEEVAAQVRDNVGRISALLQAKITGVTPLDSVERAKLIDATLQQAEIIMAEAPQALGRFHRANLRGGLNEEDPRYQWTMPFEALENVQEGFSASRRIRQKNAGQFGYPFEDPWARYAPGKPLPFGETNPAPLDPVVAPQTAPGGDTKRFKSGDIGYDKQGNRMIRQPDGNTPLWLPAERR